MSLNNEELERYSRQIVLKDIGLEGQRKLKRSRVCIVGVGGLGCYSAIQMCSMGVGFLRLIDQDVVETSNLHRQMLYDTQTLGYPKVEVAQKKLNALNPNVVIEALPLTINEETAYDIVKDVNVIIDGLDHFAPRYTINRACIKENVPFIYGGALETYGNVSTIIPKKTACLECFTGRQSDEGLPTCEMIGVTPPIIATIASIQVSEAIRVLLGRDPLLLNKVLFIDFNSFSFDSFSIAKRENCQACGVHIENKRYLNDSKIVELCGKNSFMASPKHPLALDLSNVASLLCKKFKIKFQSNFGLVFEYSDEVSISLMKTGNALIKGISSMKDAVKIYDELMNILNSESSDK